jgi:alcohol dehydrogenase
MSNAMLCPSVTGFTIESSMSSDIARFASVGRALGMCPSGVSDEEAASVLAPSLQSLATDLSVPSLSDFGITADQFENAVPDMAAAALASGSPNNNPVVPDQPAIEKLYRKIYNDSL